MTAAPAPPMPQFAVGDIDGLARAIYRRISWELRHQHCEGPGAYPPLATRIFQAREGKNAAGTLLRREERARLLPDLEADLREVLTVPTETLRRMVAMEATSARCQPGEAWALPPAPPAALPRVQPSEIISRLASRGVVIRAEDGALHVRPPELLNDADRRLLTEHKLAIVQALSGPGAVF